jgi:hypothetical protein
VPVISVVVLDIKDDTQRSFYNIKTSGHVPDLADVEEVLIGRHELFTIT